MTITISENNYGTLVLRSKNPGFVNEFGGEMVVDKRYLFATMWQIADYANNTLKDECIFDVE